MPLFILSLIIQVLLVLHVVKTGRSQTWLYIIMLLPLAGSIAYLIIEMLPELLGSRRGKKVQRKVEDIISPDKDLSQAIDAFEDADTVQGKTRLATELLKNRKYQEAQQLYKESLAGLYEHDPDIMSGLAQSEYGLGHYPASKALLEDLIVKNPDYKNADSHLLYAKTLVKLNDSDAALEELSALHTYYPGPEASYRYARLLINLGRRDEAMPLLQKLQKVATKSTKDYKSRYKKWIDLVNEEVSR
ncbi:MAG: Unknown protein [uncultured Thiotrichaceae bacterium]|uniref:Cardiolipin synthase N-terminal domain-containing protein n=1 Tax=uncultured Thiotrichaceae bacterium TaxID=298394 RepID=A0A6S6TTN6_9GAMM|nr:MAG: Unknown protein [uncultured Thiotrichaceae bacterium]